MKSLKELTDEQLARKKHCAIKNEAEYGLLYAIYIEEKRRQEIKVAEKDFAAA